jgi:hypothetical protein
VKVCLRHKVGRWQGERLKDEESKRLEGVPEAQGGKVKETEVAGRISDVGNQKNFLATD